MRVVIDTNVLVSAFRSRHGASNAVLRLVLAGRMRMLCSPPLFLEYEEVLGRREIRAATGMSPDDVADALRALSALVVPVDLSFRVRPMLKDSDDEMVLEVAINGGADAIVTHNVKDCFPARLIGVEAITPGEAILRLKQ